MDERTKGEGGFDERAALEELERFRQEIERYRARRKAVGEEFDEFIRSFKKPEELFPSELVPPASQVPPPPAPSSSSAVRGDVQPAPPASPATPPVRPAPRATSPVAAPPVQPAPQSPSPVTAPPVRPAAQSPSPVTAPPVRPAAQSAAPSVAPPAERPAAKRPRLVLGGALLLLAIAALATWSVRTDDPRPVVSQPASGQPEVVPPSAPAAPPVAAPSPAETELTTIRAVWVRVIADGERVVERELPANARVPLKATKTIVIRTGDAGAVRLSIAGQDQGNLGRDGEVVTRTFTIGEPERR